MDARKAIDAGYLVPVKSYAVATTTNLDDIASRGGDFVIGQLAAARPLGFAIDPARYPAALGWLAAMRSHPVFADDAKRTAAFLKTLASGNHERKKLFWSGDRMEWLLARGFHHWLAAEIDAGRAVFPD